MSDTKDTNFQWHELANNTNPPITEGDLRQVTLPVNVIFEWSDDIVVDYDSETNEILETTSGWVMKVLPQTVVYGTHETIFLAQTTKENT